jgi:hypothetical protein
MSYSCPHDAGNAVFNVENEIVLLGKFDGYVLPRRHAQPPKNFENMALARALPVSSKHDSLSYQCFVYATGSMLQVSPLP